MVHLILTPAKMVRLGVILIVVTGTDLTQVVAAVVIMEVARAWMAVVEEALHMRQQIALGLFTMQEEIQVMDMSSSSMRY